MKEKNRKLLYDIEKKWLDGTISDEEAELYSRWYNWVQNNEVKIPENLATNKAEHKRKLFDKIIDKLDAEGNQFRLYYRRLNGRYLRKKLVRLSAAAVFTIGIIVSGIWFYTKDNGKNNNKMVTDVTPGRSGLILTLNNGKQILLDSVKDGLISEQNGVKVYKKDNRLVYEGKAAGDIINTATTDTGRQYQIELPDHSTVWLNAVSELKYPVSFAANERKVTLKGEAYFEINHLKKDIPFIVETEGKSIKVLGTHFDVNAYGDKGNIIATLLQGKIAMQSGSNLQTILPNEAVVSPIGSAEISVKQVKASDAILWMKREFNFENLSLEDIMLQIQRWYNIQVVYDKGVDKQMQFNGFVPMNQNLSEVLKVLELSGIHFSLKNKILTVMK
ncbi:hypothetical protein A9P82_02465 [Arachidicoccus ginsenosidimutans]|uniref:FecR family protein n=1 Tax=Arachidicoccus sp. BS20 TaxID=1850526 RepID=UPI0007F13E18|nr:FecR family protein [Arachidicoccus sp. BS20]ANI88265.1 hypothetical protein A9P82_02465 [Arachidicoccus sp. BS20]